MPNALRAEGPEAESGQRIPLRKRSGRVLDVSIAETAFSIAGSLQGYAGCDRGRTRLTICATRSRNSPYLAVISDEGDMTNSAFDALHTG